MARYSQQEAREMAWKLKHLEKMQKESHELLEDLLVIYPNLEYEYVESKTVFTGTAYNTFTPQGVYKFKRHDIHIVAEHYRVIKQKEARNDRIDSSLTNIGL